MKHLKNERFVALAAAAVASVGLAATALQMWILVVAAAFALQGVIVVLQLLIMHRTHDANRLEQKIDALAVRTAAEIQANQRELRQMLQ